MLSTFNSSISEFAKKVQNEFKYLHEIDLRIWELSKVDFEYLSELINNLPKEMDSNHLSQLTELVSDIEDRIRNNIKENTKNKSLIIKFLSELTLQIDINKNKKGLQAIENNALDSKKIDFENELMELNKRNSDSLNDLINLVQKIKSKTGIKHNDHDRIEEIVNSIINARLNEIYSNLSGKIKNVEEKKINKMLDDESVASLHKSKNDFQAFRVNVLSEIDFLKGELSKIRSDSVDYFTNLKDKTNYLEKYLEDSHDEISSRFDDLHQNNSLKNKMVYH